MPTYNPNNPRDGFSERPNYTQYFFYAAAAIFAIVLGLSFFGSDESPQRAADNQSTVTGPGATSKQPSAPAPQR